MEAVATFLLLLVLGGGALLVVLVIGLVSGSGVRARLRALEEELGSFRGRMKELHTHSVELHERVGFLEAELAKARSAVGMILISLAYQRYVFGKRKRDAS
jgi:hypothetical protein